MSESAWAERYQLGIRRFQEHLTQIADGTWHLDVPDATSMGVDPVVFADLKRSLDETNNKIRRKEISPEEIGKYDL
jgi:hypothetical protein